MPDNNANAGVLASIGGDAGEVRFAIDLALGIVHITVRAPLAIAPVKATLTVLDFLDFAAQTTLEINKQQRAMINQLRQGGSS